MTATEPQPAELSLLISPEGWLIGLFEIEEAEKGELDEHGVYPDSAADIAADRNR